MFRTAAVVIILLSILLRLLACFDDFWLDEIWSLQLACEARSCFEIITTLQHDNNHPLNTLWLFVAGQNAGSFIHRIPALLCGCLTVVYAGFRVWRKDRYEALIAWILFGCSYFLIQYSSEARGYGPLMLCTLLSIDIFERLTVTRERRTQLLFVAVTVVGMLAHASYFFVYAGLVVSDLYGNKSSWSRQGIADGVKRHIVPTVFGVTLLLLNYSQLERGGGDHITVVAALIECASVFAGGPFEGTASILVAILSSSLILAVLASSYRYGSSIRFSVVAPIVVSPAVAALLLQATPVYPRYFLVSVVILLSLAAGGFARLRRSKPALQVAGYVLLGTWLAGNVVHVTRMLESGRGQYRAAVLMMTESPGESPVVVGSDHDFRNKIVLEYHWQQVRTDRVLKYVSEGEWPDKGPDWVLLHEPFQVFAPPFEIGDAAGNTYGLKKKFPHYGLSGWHWALYRNDRSTNRGPTFTNVPD